MSDFLSPHKLTLSLLQIVHPRLEDYILGTCYPEKNCSLCLCLFERSLPM